MSPINILYLINELGYGGTEGQLIRLVQHLDRAHFCPHIATLRNSSRFLEQLNVPSLKLDFKGFRDTSLFSQIARLVAFVKRYQITLVQTFFQDPHVLGAILKCLARVKLVGSFRDLGFWRTSSGTAKIRLSDFFYDGYVANSEAVRNYSSVSFGIRPGKITRIYNGFHFNGKAASAHPPDATDSPVVGIVANLNRKVKRVEDFITMASFVRGELPGTTFIVIGEGNLKEELIRYGNRLGLEDSISFLGSLPNPLDHIKKFKVGVITSESEGFSNAIIEYMACGVPVVATDVGGNTEIITPGENGYLVPVRNPSAMAEKVIFLLRSASHAGEIARANRERISQHFTLARMVQQHEAYYRSVLNGGRQ